jgi:hypothetical protein
MLWRALPRPGAVSFAKHRRIPNVTDDHRAQLRSKQRSKAASLTIPCKIIVNGVGSTPTSPMSTRPCKLIDVLGHEIASAVRVRTF